MLALRPVRFSQPCADVPGTDGQGPNGRSMIAGESAQRYSTAGVQFAALRASRVAVSSPS
jgi:hypothetical protein